MTLILTAGLVFARVSGMITSMPVLSARMIPSFVKIIVSVLLAALLTPVVPPTQSDLGIEFLLVTMASEFLLGVLLGGSMTIVFASMSIMSAIVSTQIGQSAAAQFNPMMSDMMTPIGNMATYFALAIFLGSNSHLIMLEILAESFQIVPIEHVLHPIEGTRFWLELSDGIFMVALKMSLPMMLLTLLINSFIAILSKIAQTMNMFFSVGFIITIYLGMVLFGFVLPNILAYNQHMVAETLLELPKIFDLVGGQ